MKQFLVACWVLAMGLVVSETGAAGATLTGSSLYSVTSGNFDGVLYWDTTGGNFAWNLYFTNTSNAFLNSGDLPVATSLNLPLPAGTTTLNFFAESGSGLNLAGLNLFFNGSSSPGISALTTVGSSGFSPFSGSSAGLNASGPSVPGANTLTFSDGSATVTLVGLTIAAPDSTDNVFRYSNAPGGNSDYVGSLQLEVVPDFSIPEPATLALLASGLLALGVRGRKTN